MDPNLRGRSFWQWDLFFSALRYVCLELVSVDACYFYISISCVHCKHKTFTCKSTCIKRKGAMGTQTIRDKTCAALSPVWFKTSTSIKIHTVTRSIVHTSLVIKQQSLFQSEGKEFH